MIWSVPSDPDPPQPGEEYTRVLAEACALDQGLPYPNWTTVSEWFRQNVAEDEAEVFWETVARAWVGRLRDALGDPYAVRDSDNFILLSAEGSEQDELLLGHAERSRVSIMRALGGLALTGTYGPHVILWMRTPTDYWRYLSHFVKRRKSMASAGVFINPGYGHIALAPQVYWSLEITLYHELIHNYLMHLRLPRWLNEAIASEAELAGGYGRHFQMDTEKARRHWEFWDVEKIQGFWKGTTFSLAGKASELSYELAKTLLQLIRTDVTRDPQRFVNFVKEASAEDGGEASARKHLQCSLAEVAAIFLGEGYWWPQLAPAEEPQSPTPGGSAEDKTQIE